MSDVYSTWEQLEEAIPRDLFRSEVATWAQRIGVEPREVHIRPMRRKWGSCSTSGRVTFNSELLLQPAAFRRRVIVEELLHLKVPNHGRLFRALMKAHIGRDAFTRSPEELLPPEETIAPSNSAH